MLATSVNVSPPISTGRGSIAAYGRRPSSAFSIAFSAVHGRAEWPLTPWKVIRAFRLPRQPAWIVLSVGSSRIASSGLVHDARVVEEVRQRAVLGRQLLLPEREQGEVDVWSHVRSSSARASSSITASPPFMSLAPSPTTAPFSIRPGTFSCAGTVS